MQKIHPRFRTPYITSIVTGLAVGHSGRNPAGTRCRQVVSIGTLLAFVIVCTGVLVLRVREPNLHRPFKTPLCGSSRLWVLCRPLPMFYLDAQTWLRLLIWLAIGFLIYFLYSRTHSRLASPGGS